MNRQSGFTLIELVLVIIIIGILAATALPRFVKLDSNARVAAVEGLAGSLRSAAALAHATQLAQGLASNASISMDGVTVTMSNAYPDAAGIVNAVTDTTGFTVAGTGPVTFTPTSASANCLATYNLATASVGATATFTSSGC